MLVIGIVPIKKRLSGCSTRQASKLPGIPSTLASQHYTNANGISPSKKGIRMENNCGYGVDPKRLYLQTELQEMTGLGVAAWRQMRRQRSLKVYRCGNRNFVLGRDFIISVTMGGIGDA